MKKNYFITLLFTFFMVLTNFGQTVTITSVIDGKAPSDGCDGSSGSSSPKAVELYVSGTVDFTNYTLDVESNGPSSGNLSWSSESIAGLGTRTDEFVYVVALGTTTLKEMFSGATDSNIVEGISSFNGNDAIRITDGTNVLDQIGDPNDVTGSSDHDNPWAFQDSYVTRKDGSTPNGGSFDVSNWNILGDNYFDNNSISSCADMLAEVNFGSFLTVASTSPEVSTSGSVSNLFYFEGKGPSEEGDFSMSGSNLTADVTVDAPTNFEVSLTSEGNFASSVSVTQTDGNASATVFVRLKAGLSVNTYSGDVTVSSAGATDATISVTGEVEPATPQFSVTAFLDDFNYILSEGGPSAEDDFSISGDNLSGDIIITAPDNFEVSLTSESSFMNSLSITPTDGSVPFTSVYVRLKTGLSEGNYMGDISIISEGVSEEIISISGNVFGAPSSSMIITGAYDGPLSGGTPKGVELYVLKDISDLSVFGVSSVTNGQGSTDGNVEFSFPSGTATKGTFIYVASEETGFESFFGMKPTYTTGVMNINGDDAIELYENGQIIDVFGTVDCDPNASGTTCPEWDHLDGWAYRKSNTGPEGTTFTSSNWTYSTANALDGESTNAGATTPFPIGTYINTTASIKNNSIEGFATYPNPVTNNQFTITSNSLDTKKVAIFNVIGKKVFTTSVAGTKSTIDVSSISSGLYILKVTEGNKIATSKLVIK